MSNDDIALVFSKRLMVSAILNVSGVTYNVKIILTMCRRVILLINLKD